MKTRNSKNKKVRQLKKTLPTVKLAPCNRKEPLKLINQKILRRRFETRRKKPLLHGKDLPLGHIPPPKMMSSKLTLWYSHKRNKVNNSNKLRKNLFTLKKQKSPHLLKRTSPLILRKVPPQKKCLFKKINKIKLGSVKASNKSQTLIMKNLKKMMQIIKKTECRR